MVPSNGTNHTFMSSKFNLLLPEVAERAWENLIPELVVFTEDYISLKFTSDSTKANIQTLFVMIDQYCCSSKTEGVCKGDSENKGKFFLFFQVSSKRGPRIKTDFTSVAIWNEPDYGFQCVNRAQKNKCIGDYDSFVDGIDFYNVIASWSNQAVSVDGSLSNTKLHKVVALGNNICKKDTGIVQLGKNILTSLSL